MTRAILSPTRWGRVNQPAVFQLLIRSVPHSCCHGMGHAGGGRFWAARPASCHPGRSHQRGRSNCSRNTRSGSCASSSSQSCKVGGEVHHGSVLTKSVSKFAQDRTHGARVGGHEFQGQGRSARNRLLARRRAAGFRARAGRVGGWLGGLAAALLSAGSMLAVSVPISRTPRSARCCTVAGSKAVSWVSNCWCSEMWR